MGENDYSELVRWLRDVDTCFDTNVTSAAADAITALVAERDEANKMYALAEANYEACQDALKMTMQSNTENSDRANAAEAKGRRYEEALRFYADETTYVPKGFNVDYEFPVMDDRGQRAREALASGSDNGGGK